jgi:hypothetical protein
MPRVPLGDAIGATENVRWDDALGRYVPDPFVGGGGGGGEPVGAKYFTYNPDGTIAQIVGTGGYRTKTFAYNPDGTLQSITVT